MQSTTTLGRSIDRTERIIEPIEPTTDGPGGAGAPSEPPLASAFGDTNGEFFGRTLRRRPSTQLFFVDISWGRFCQKF